MRCVKSKERGNPWSFTRVSLKAVWSGVENGSVAYRLSYRVEGERRAVYSEGNSRKRDEIPTHIYVVYGKKLKRRYRELHYKGKSG